MSDLSERLARLSPEKRELLERRLRSDQARSRPAVEPIAIVGMACRLPGGVETPEAFWTLLAEGRDAVTEVPDGRWDAAALFSEDASVPGTVMSRWGGFLHDVDKFDAGFFGISPREASRMDPQQRVFLEVAWDALDDAGQDAQRLAGSRTGVFAGIHSHSADYFWFDLAHPERMDSFTGPGTSHSILTGRLSYLFDLQGPSVAIDTACSSSLVAVHLACQSLRAGEITMALAGGVNVVLSPDFTIALSRLQMLSPDGRCRTFDARANGFVRSEGCAMLVLKRLSDAHAHGDRIHAVIRGSAINQDGRTNGITAPSGLSQQRVIELALANAGVDAADIGYVEAHGTGTSLGDPIEVEALAAALGVGGGRSRPCYLGSAKSNIGHAEGAAGVTGLIKAVLSLQRHAVPPLAHFTALNPHISLDGTRFQIPTTLRPWEAGGRRRLAGVSSFGWSGTNAHVVVEEAPVPKRPVEPGSDGRVRVLPLSARSEKALSVLADRYGEQLGSLPADSTGPLDDLCYSAALRRTHHDYRVAVTGRSPAELAQRLNAFRQGHTTWDVAMGRAVAGRRTSLVFVFSGQGPQWWGMGRQLFASSEPFRDQVERCSALLLPLAGWSIVDELHCDEAQSRLHRTDVAQPVLFALQTGLSAMWQALGVAPAAVAGHSAGEIAAAHVAGVLDLDEAIRVVFHRGALMQRAEGTGKMVAVEIGASDVEPVLATAGGRVSLAAINAPRSCVLSGEPAAVDDVVASLQRSGVLCRPLRVAYAFHSTQMDGIASDFAAALGPVACKAPRLLMVSSVTGLPVTGPALDAAYWERNVRQTVMFGQAVAALAARGHRLFVELSPHPVLASAIAAVGQPDDPFVALPSLVRGRDEAASVAATVAGLYAAGYPVEWRRLCETGQVVDLPRYPWQRERHWLPEAPAGQRSADRGRGRTGGRTLLGRRLRSPQLPGLAFETELSSDSPAWLAEHRIHGAVLVPGAAMIAMAIAAAEAACGGRPFELREFLIRRPLVLDETPRVVQTLVTPRAGDQFDLEIQSLEDPDRDQWVLHVSSRVSLAASSGPTDLPPLDVVRSRCVEEPIERHYERLRQAGASLGEPLRALQQLRVRPGESLGTLDLPRSLTAERTVYRVHPSLLDGSLQSILGGLGRDAESGALYVPQAVDVIRIGHAGHGRLVSHAITRRTQGPDSPVFADVTLRDDAGHMVAMLRGVVLGRAPREAVRAADRAYTPWLYEESWTVATDDALPRVDGQPRRWLIFVDRQGVGDALVGMLERAGHTCIRVVSGPDYAVLSPTHLQVDPLDRGHVERVCGDVLSQPCAGVVFGWMLDADMPSPTAADERPGDSLQRRKCGTALALLQYLGALDPARRTALHVLTRGAQAVADGENVNPAQATVWGMARTAALEYPDLRVVSVDLDPAAGLDDRHVLRATISAGGSEREIAIRGGQRYVRRIRRLDLSAAGAAVAQEPVRLEIPTRGVLDDLRLDPIERPEPGPGEIAIEVRAAGLNFRDVLNALGTYPGDAGAFGSECAGIVSAVGRGVATFVPGDAVVALADASMASHVVTPAVRAVAKPASLSFDAAATLPIAFLTAEYALHDLAQLQPGERVLIHAAAGGVGLAAVQLAQRTGAIVYATAGSPEKHRFLRSLGVDHVLSSRSLEFADQLMTLTEGRGVDVALNSLAGQFIPRTLAALAPGGRFVEIGKTDIWDRTRVRAIRPDVQYHTLYLGEIIESRPDRTAQMLAGVVAGCVRGDLKPLPVRTFPLEDAASAFRHMAQAKHIGKVVLAPARRPGVGGAADLPVASDATYLITGGLGNLGLNVARWLASHGARHLVLLGRREPGEAAARAVGELQQAGVRVVVEQADVADPPALDEVLARLDGSMPALRGVVHAAGVLDDGVIAQQDWARFAAVMRPKVDGAWNLHRATFDRPLDFFVLFSAAASAFGSAGQANYAAANAFLDTLAHLRRAQDMPALSVSWGAWADGGMVSALGPRDQQRLAQHGLDAMPAADALAALGELLTHQRATAIVADVDWTRYRAWVSQLPPWLSAVTAERRPKAPAADTEPSLLALLAGAPPARRLSMLVSHVHQQALRVLGLAPTYPLDAYQGLRDVGLDSLMAIELRNHLQRSVERELPTTLAFDYPTVDAIARHLAEVLAAASRPVAGAETDRSAIDAVGAMSDEEAEAMLSAELAGLNPSEAAHE